MPGLWEIVIVCVVLLVLFPTLVRRPAKGIGQSLGILRRWIDDE